MKSKKKIFVMVIVGIIAIAILIIPYGMKSFNRQKGINAILDGRYREASDVLYHNLDFRDCKDLWNLLFFERDTIEKYTTKDFDNMSKYDIESTLSNLKKLKIEDAEVNKLIKEMIEELVPLIDVAQEREAQKIQEEERLKLVRKEYEDFIFTYSTGLTPELRELENLGEEVSANATLLTDSNWTKIYLVHMSTIKSLCQSLIEYDKALIPDTHKEGHDLLLNASSDYIQAMDLFADGVNNIDTVNIGKGLDYLSSGTEYIVKAASFFASISESKPSSSTSTVKFTNKFGTSTTKCAISGCNNYIAPSGDTNCCIQHSNKCAECGIYIDSDAALCLDCIEKSLKK